MNQCYIEASTGLIVVSILEKDIDGGRFCIKFDSLTFKEAKRHLTDLLPGIYEALGTIRGRRVYLEMRELMQLTEVNFKLTTQVAIDKLIESVKADEIRAQYLSQDTGDILQQICRGERLY